MKEEEIRPIAENYVEEFCLDPDGEYTEGSLVCAGIGTAMIVARMLEKQIKELQEQIDKMKCCNNCKYCCYMDWKPKCCFDMTEIRDIENPVTFKCKRWEWELAK